MGGEDDGAFSILQSRSSCRRSLLAGGGCMYRVRAPRRVYSDRHKPRVLRLKSICLAVTGEQLPDTTSTGCPFRGWLALSPLKKVLRISRSYIEFRQL